MLSSTQFSKTTLWGTILIAASLLFSFVLACATPFVALGVVAVLTLPRNYAIVAMLTVWACNQFIGFVFQNYPIDVITIAWGAVLGFTAIACVEVARFAARKSQGQAAFQASVAFIASFVAYEVILIAASLILGGIESFTFAIQSEIFALNILASALFFAIAYIANGLGMYKVKAA